MTLSSSAPTGLVTGEAVTFTATVTASPGPPFTGSIVFGVVGSQGAVATCDGGDAQPLSTTEGVTTATCSFADGLPGKQLNYTVSANLVDPHYTAPTATLVQRINKSLTETTISGLAGSVIAGEAFTFTATVQDVAPGTGSPTGVMQFALCPQNRPPPCTGYPSGASQLPAPSPQEQALNENQITFSLPSGVLKPGFYAVSAIYVGDSNYRSSPSPLSNFLVTKVPTTLALVASRNPAFDGGRLVLRAIITPDPRATSSLSGPSGKRAIHHHGFFGRHPRLRADGYSSHSRRHHIGQSGPGPVQHHRGDFGGRLAIHRHGDILGRLGLPPFDSERGLHRHPQLKSAR